MARAAGIAVASQGVPAADRTFKNTRKRHVDRGEFRFFPRPSIPLLRGSASTTLLKERL
jgi:hypothetical protein